MPNGEHCCDRSAVFGGCVMESEDESAFKSPVDPKTPQLPSGRYRQLSVPEMVTQRGGIGDGRQAKRAAPSPLGADSMPPNRDAAPSQSQTVVRLDEATVKALRELMREICEENNAKLISVVEKRLESCDRRIQILEGEMHDQSIKIQDLSKQLAVEKQMNKELNNQLEQVDNNHRQACLILSCSELSSIRDEDLQTWIVEAVNARYNEVQLSHSDIDIAHRLQVRDKVICKFVRRSQRDAIYNGRMQQNRSHRSSASGSGRRLVPLYITESLTQKNKYLFNQLLQARRPCNGQLVATVFSRRGSVICRQEKTSRNLYINSDDDLTKVIGNRRFSAPERQRRRDGDKRDLPGPTRGPMTPAAGAGSADARTPERQRSPPARAAAGAVSGNALLCPPAAALPPWPATLSPPSGAGTGDAAD